MRLIRYFTKTGNYVLDPFCGVAFTLKACDLSGRIGVGIELSEIWVDIGKKRLREEVGSNSNAKIIQGDARDKLRNLKAETFDYLVTSPPYWQILNKKADHKVKKERTFIRRQFQSCCKLSEMVGLRVMGTLIYWPSKEIKQCFLR